MTRPARAACLVALLAGACHTPAYEVARERATQKLERACLRHSDLKLWAAGADGYLVTARCTKLGPARVGRTPPEITEPLTIRCETGKCTPMVGLGDWVGRVPAAPATASDPGGGATEAEIRAQIDARAAAILACVNGETTAVQVELVPGRTTISLTGRHAKTPGEGCVRAALPDLKPLAPGGAPITVRHPVIAN